MARTAPVSVLGNKKRLSFADDDDEEEEEEEEVHRHFRPAGTWPVSVPCASRLEVPLISLHDPKKKSNRRRTQIDIEAP